MVAVAFSVALLGLSQLARASSIPSRTWARKEQAEAAPAIPTVTVLQDFAKNNVTAKWAEGHPKQWGTEEARFEYPLPPGSYYFTGTVSDDDRLIALSNGTHVKILQLDTGAVVSEIGGLSFKDVTKLLLLPLGDKGHDLIVSNEYNSAQIHISPEGKAIGEARAIPGRLSGFTSNFTSKNGRRLVTIQHRPPLVYVHDLDNPSWNLTLDGHADSIMTAVYSPDDAYIATSSWDQTAKLWNATTGEVLQSFGPSGGQNWNAEFSPNGKQLLIGSGNKKITIWDLTKPTADPLVLPQAGWTRVSKWTSDSELLATGSDGQMSIYSFKENRVIQLWKDEDRFAEVTTLAWIEEGGSRQLAYRALGGFEVYDFEKNLKYRWGPGDFDHWSGSNEPIEVLKSKGWIGGSEADGTLRFWKAPA